MPVLVGGVSGGVDRGGVSRVRGGLPESQSTVASREPPQQGRVESLMMMEDITQSLNRLNQLSFRLRLLREQAVWQREATSTVTELLAAAADLESLAAERMRLLATVNQIRRKPRRSVPLDVVEGLPTLSLAKEEGGEPCSVCLAQGGKRVMFSHLLRLLISSHVVTQFPLISWDERSSLVEFSKSGPFP